MGIEFRARDFDSVLPTSDGLQICLPKAGEAMA
jgi:hypothetical protein